MQRLVPELTSAVQDNLVEISNLLLKHGVITTGNHNEFTDPRLASSHVRASSLIRTVLNRIEIDASYFEKFVKVLEENEPYYEAVLDKLRVDLAENKQLVSSPGPFYDFEQSDHESSTLLKLRTPYVQYEDEPRRTPQQGYSAAYTKWGVTSILACLWTILLSGIIYQFIISKCKGIFYLAIVSGLIVAMIASCVLCQQSLIKVGICFVISCIFITIIGSFSLLHIC